VNKWAHELHKELSKEAVQMHSKCMKECSTFLVIKDANQNLTKISSHLS
jgi:hypothetical protein